jgi:hypothetical protein
MNFVAFDKSNFHACQYSKITVAESMVPAKRNCAFRNALRRQLQSGIEASGQRKVCSVG